ncbi:UNVERIFIED_CONTAM: hypothetical protein FKN15_076943 [Acipenser sinensis]
MNSWIPHCTVQGVHVSLFITCFSKASNTLRQENQDVKAARQKAKEPDENIGSFVLDLLKEEQGGQRAMRVFGFSIGGVVLLTLFPIVCCRIMQGRKEKAEDVHKPTKAKFSFEHLCV